MEDVLQQILSDVGTYVPKMLLALLVIAVGWVVALGLAAVVRSSINRVGAGKAFGRAFKAEGLGEMPPLGAWIGRIVFYIVLVFVLAAAFHVLQLTALAGPFDGLLDELATYLPRLLGAAVLLLIAWVVGAGLRIAVTKAVARTALDQQLVETAGLGAHKPFSRTLGEVVFWLPLLMLLPAVLGALGLDGLLGPVQRMFDQLLGALPNLLAAGLVLLVGWFIARILRSTVTALLGAAGLDALGERVGMGADAGARRLSAVGGLLVYALILIPTAIAALDALKLAGISRPASMMLQNILSAIPLVLAAGVVLGIAYLVGRVVAGLVSDLLAGVGFDTMLKTMGLKLGDRAERTPPSQIVGYLTLVAIMLVAAIEASSLLGFGALSALVVQFFGFATRLLLGLVIFGIGLYLGNLAYRAIPRSEGRWAGVFPSAARIATVVLATAMALEQMEVAGQIVTIAFGVVLGAIGVALAIAFGLGGRDSAQRLVKDWLEE